MITITTSKGKSMPAAYILPMARAERLLIALDDARNLSAIAADFEGCKSIKSTDDTRPGETRLYDGYTKLTEIRRMDDGTARMTLAQG